MTVNKLQITKPRIRTSADGLVNVYTGMGTNKSRSANNQWSYGGFLTGPLLDVIYRESWLAQAIASIPAEDATREWRTFSGKDAEEIHRVESQLDLQTKVAEVKTFSRVYGGAAILMLTGQNLEEPLDLNKVKKDSLEKLLVIDRHDLSAPIMNLTNPLKENYLLPEFYTMVHGSQRIHHTHLVRFQGTKLPRRIAAHEHGWSDSELRRILTDINNTVASFSGISELMQQANVDVISKEGLVDDLTSDQDEEIIKRYMLFNLMKSNYGLSLLDATEQIDRKTLNLTGIAPSLEQLLTWISGAARIPVTRLFGTSAKGMNATGEGDERVYYDYIKGIQTRQLRSPLTQLDQILVRSALGTYPDDTDFSFNPLSQLSSEEQANKEYTDSQTDRTYYDMGVVTKAHIARKLQANDTYQITDDEIDELEKAAEEEDYNDEFNADPLSEEEEVGSEPAEAE